MTIAISRSGLAPMLVGAALLFLPADFTAPAKADGGSDPGQGVLFPDQQGGAAPKSKGKAPAGKPRQESRAKSLKDEKRAIEKDIRTAEENDKKLGREMDRLIEFDKKLLEKLRKRYDEIEEEKSKARQEFARKDDEEGACCGGGKKRRQELFREMNEKIDKLDEEYRRFFEKTLDDARSWGDPDTFRKYQDMKKERAANRRKLDKLRKDLGKVEKALKGPIVQP